ncbi:MAG: hypothetical protein JNL74_13295 [Fibrobacteres bacterium]|nr:hypothetical protein [Fibrobacterota bacterium]
MKYYLALFLVALITLSCNETKQITQPAEDKALTLTKVTWITDTMRTTSLIFGKVCLYLAGRTKGNEVRVETHGDGLRGYELLRLNSNFEFSDTIDISFTHWATSKKFVKSTKIKTYKDSILIDSILLTSDSISYYTPSKYSLLEDSIRYYRNIWGNSFINTYSYLLSRYCECLQSTSGPFYVYVKNNIVDSVYNISTSSALPDSLNYNFRTISDEYTSLLALVWSKPSEMTITFNQQFGYPSTVLCDPVHYIADDEIQYTIDSLKYSK